MKVSFFSSKPKYSSKSDFENEKIQKKRKIRKMNVYGTNLDDFDYLRVPESAK